MESLTRLHAGGELKEKFSVALQPTVLSSPYLDVVGHPFDFEMLEMLEQAHRCGPTPSHRIVQKIMSRELTRMKKCGHVAVVDVPSEVGQGDDDGRRIP